MAIYVYIKSTEILGAMRLKSFQILAHQYISVFALFRLPSKSLQNMQKHTQHRLYY